MGAVAPPSPGVMTGDQAIVQALQDLTRALDELAVPAMIIGGIAVIARGVPRHTIDIDAAVWAEGLDVERLIDLLASHQIVPRIADARTFARERQVLLLRHEPSGTPLELSLAWLPFEREALDRATRVDFGSVVASVATPEDLVIYKAVAWRDRDRTDIERLLALHATTIDLARVRSLVRQFAEALDEPGRVDGFDALVRHVLGPGG